MGGREIAVVVLLGVAGLVVVLSAVGFLAAGDTLPRLHFVTPVTSVAGPLTGAAYVVQLGPGLAAGLAVLVVALLAVTGPVLGSAVARVGAAEEGLLPDEDQA
jgi:multisubunit Na+/H+ antiporter MnhG subunit